MVADIVGALLYIFCGVCVCVCVCGGGGRSRETPQRFTTLKKMATMIYRHLKKDFQIQTLKSSKA